MRAIKAEIMPGRIREPGLICVIRKCIKPASFTLHAMPNARIGKNVPHNPKTTFETREITFEMF
jgi:hypothetical protein